MIFVKNSRGGREANMIKILSKINLSKIGLEGGGSTSIWIMSVNILCVFLTAPLSTLILVNCGKWEFLVLEGEKHIHSILHSPFFKFQAEKIF